MYTTTMTTTNRGEPQAQPRKASFSIHGSKQDDDDDDDDKSPVATWKAG
jgi:hypothetical protein